MRTSKVESLCNCYRADKPASNDKVSKAVQAAEKNPELKNKLSEQVALDTRIGTVVRAIPVPEALPEQLLALKEEAGGTHWKKVVMQPPIIAVGIAILVLAVLMVFFGINRMNDFEGRDRLVELLMTPENMTGNELEPVEQEARRLSDWFFLKYGLEHYDVPAEFGHLKAAGVRVFKQEGFSVAQIAVEKDEVFFYLFRTEDFGLKGLSEKDWKFFEEGEWSAAVRREGELCLLVAYPGTPNQLKQFLATAQAK